MSVLLVNMPIVDLQRPNLGLSLLQALLHQHGMDCKVVYGNLLFAERIGVVSYLSLSNGTRSWFTLLLGEAVFRSAAFPDHPLEEQQLLDFVMRGQPTDGLRRSFRDLQRLARELVWDLAEEIVAARPRLVGCTSTFQQHLPSLALLRRIRELDPGIITMMGGANCETQMGVATHRNFPWVDYVVSGEADGLIVPLCRQLLDGGELLEVPEGVLAPVHRRNGYPDNSRATFNALDSLPYPDFSDYFAQLKASRLAPAIRVGLPVETSRGCWWGAKHHCTFCGLNGGGMAFRRKSPERALAEMEWLAERWDISSLEVVDNILDMRYLDTVIPALAASPRDWNIFYEVKSNLRPEQMKALAAAGVRSMQPGIESLDSRVLTLMDKGAKGWQQVQFLKFAREYGIEVSWNMLMEFPGEEDSWYLEMAELMPLLYHLQAPSGVVGIRIDRYSPYFEKPERYGIQLRTHPMVKFLYPVPPEQAFDLGYHFERVSPPGPVRAGLQAVERAAEQWRKVFFQGESRLQMTVEGDELHIVDTRPCALAPLTILQGEDRRVYLACTQAVPSGDLPGAVLQRLREARLLITLDDRHLALAVSAQAPAYPYFPPFPGGVVQPAALDVQDLVPRGGAFERMFWHGGSLT